MGEMIRNALAIRVLMRAGIFVEMRMVDRGGEPQTQFVVKHHGVTSVMGRSAAVALAKTMEQIARADEFSALVWDDRRMY